MLLRERRAAAMVLVVALATAVWTFGEDENSDEPGVDDQAASETGTGVEDESTEGRVAIAEVPEEEADEEQVSDSDSNAEDQEDEEQEERDLQDTFEPSEDISEDYAVPFPVDI